MTPYERAGRQSAHSKLAAGITQADATAMGDLTGLHGDPGTPPFTDQFLGKTVRHGLVGAGLGGVYGAIRGGLLGRHYPNVGPGLGSGLGGASCAILGGALGAAHGMLSGTSARAQNMARDEGMRGVRTIRPELLDALATGLGGGMLGGVIDLAAGGDTGLVGAGIGGIAGAAAGAYNAKNMRELGRFRAHTKREAPLDDLTHLMKRSP